MRFDIKKCYSALNAELLKKGDLIVGASSLKELKDKVHKNKTSVLDSINNEVLTYRFGTKRTNYILAYLVEKAGCKNCVGCKKIKSEDKLLWCEKYKRAE